MTCHQHSTMKVWAERVCISTLLCATPTEFEHIDEFSSSPCPRLFFIAAHDHLFGIPHIPHLSHTIIHLFDVSQYYTTQITLQVPVNFIFTCSLSSQELEHMHRYRHCSFPTFPLCVIPGHVFLVNTKKSIQTSNGELTNKLWALEGEGPKSS